MKIISSLFLISCLLFIFIIGCSENLFSYNPNIEVEQEVNLNPASIINELKKSEPFTYEVKTYIWLNVIEDYGNIIDSKYEYVTCEEIPKTKADQMIWALKLKEEYENKLKKLPNCENE